LSERDDAENPVGITVRATGEEQLIVRAVRAAVLTELLHQVRKSSVTRLRELAEPRRRAALVCFLWQSYRDAVDQAVDMSYQLSY
jgi:hypothetical protein